MKYLLMFVLLFVMGNSNAHEISTYTDNPAKYIHFHDVKWKSCISADFCVFSVKGIHPFFGESLVINITTFYVPSYSEGQCVAERRYGGQMISELNKYFKKAKLINLNKCHRRFINSSIINCIVNIDGKLINEWLKENFVMSYIYVNWCE